MLNGNRTLPGSIVGSDRVDDYALIEEMSAFDDIEAPLGQTIFNEKELRRMNKYAYSKGNIFTTYLPEFISISKISKGLERHKIIPNVSIRGLVGQYDHGIGNIIVTTAEDSLSEMYRDIINI